MYMENISVENDDIPVGFTITGSGVAMPLDVLLDIYIWLYVTKGIDKLLLATYKKSDSGRSTVAIDPLNSSRCTIIISREVSNRYAGRLFAEIKLVAAATNDYKDSTQNKGVTDIRLVTLNKSVSPYNPF